MGSEVKLWKVEADRLTTVEPDRLDLEDRLENWLCGDISLLCEDLLVIGRQIHKRKYGGVLDLLAIDRNGSLVVIELKRDKTPREVVAQALDYASWVYQLSWDDVERQAKDYLKEPFEKAFENAFDQDLPEMLNERPRIFIVAASLDASTQRIVEYLAAAHGVEINAATFSYYNIRGGEFIGRSMLLDDEANVHRKRGRGNRRLATKRLSPRVEQGQLVVEFPEEDLKKSWELPEPADTEAIRRIREAASSFARDHGATEGQVAAVKKKLTENGYYVTG